MKNTLTIAERRKYHAEYARKWREKNRDRHRENRRLWRSKNVDKAREKNKTWRQSLAGKQWKRLDLIKNRKKYLEQARKRRLANLDRARLLRREYYHKNRDKLRAYAKKLKALHPERQRRYRVNHRKNNRSSLIWSASKRHSLKSNLGFDLTREWIDARLNAGECELTGIKFDMEGKRTRHTPSIDRINPSGGYTQNNCRIVLWSINRALCDYGLEYMLDIFSRIKARQPT